MSETAAATRQLITELKATAHLMLLEPGVYCIFHTPSSPAPDPSTGLPGARVSLPPGVDSQSVSITSFRGDGWLGLQDAAALIRVSGQAAHVMVTVYQLENSAHEMPRLEVMRLAGAAAAPAQAPPRPADAAAADAIAAAGEGDGKPTVTGGGEGTPAPEPEIAAHVQLRGDVLARIGDWVGDRGSQRWVEGFALAPRGEVRIDEVEYQAVLGRGWLSPWAEGGQFCGSRGMALPILGLRVRLRGAAAASHAVELSATFTDGTAIGPVGAGDACEAASLAPLEAFQVVLRPVGAADKAPARGKPAAKPAPRQPLRRLPAAPAPAKPVLAKPVLAKPAPKPATPPVVPAAPKRARGR